MRNIIGRTRSVMRADRSGPVTAVRHGVAVPPSAVAFGPAWRSKAGLATSLVVVGLCGLFTSFVYHFAIWGIDPDTLESAIVWQGIRAHGLAFLKSWAFTPDNWLLTLIAPTSLLYELVGAPPLLVVGTGWLIFLGNVALTAAIGTILAGRLVGLAIAASLLADSQDTLGWVGFMSHPASHDVSLLWGLAALLCMALWLRGGTWLWLGLAGLGLAADCISDPWSQVAFALPMLLAAGLAAFRGSIRGRAAACCLASLAAVAVAVTKAFGWLDFLPESPIRLADFPIFYANAGWLAQSIGLLFNPLPGLHRGTAATTAAVCLILAALVGRSAWELERGTRTGPPAEQFLLTAVALSALLPCAAFLVCQFPLDINVGRFAASLVVFAPLLVFVGLGRCWRSLPLWVKLGGPLFFSLVAVAGFASNPAAWRHGWRGLITHDVLQLAAFLEADGLNYGFGPYWGSSANAVTWISHGAVTIRPVRFDPATGFITPGSGQTSAGWYLPTDAPAGQKLFFVAVTDDGENCPRPEVCLAGLAKQFGPPLRTDHYRNIAIPVWDHPLPVGPRGS